MAEVYYDTKAAHAHVPHECTLFLNIIDIKDLTKDFPGHQGVFGATEKSVMSSHGKLWLIYVAAAEQQ